MALAPALVALAPALVEVAENPPPRQSSVVAAPIIKPEPQEYNNKNDFASYGEFAFDWETRRYFTSYATNFMKSESVDSTFMQKTRLGIAPYISGYGALHTWLMYELNSMPEYDDTLISNFVLRLFKSTNLLELGIDQNKNTTINFIKRF